MWKGRAVVSSAVEGMQDQIEDAALGILLRDPSDRSEFAAALTRVLSDPTYAEELAERAAGDNLNFLTVHLHTSCRRGYSQKVDEVPSHAVVLY